MALSFLISFLSGSYALKRTEPLVKIGEDILRLVGVPRSKNSSFGPLNPVFAANSTHIIHRIQHRFISGVLSNIVASLEPFYKSTFQASCSKSSINSKFPKLFPTETFYLGTSSAEPRTYCSAGSRGIYSQIIKMFALRNIYSFITGNSGYQFLDKCLDAKVAVSAKVTQTQRQVTIQDSRRNNIINRPSICFISTVSSASN